MPFTVSATIPRPYVHLDNRGLVLAHDGRCATFFGAPMLRWASETLGIIEREERATRERSGCVLGGFFVEGGDVVLFGSDRNVSATVQLDRAGFDELLGEIRSAVTELYPEAAATR